MKTHVVPASGRPPVSTQSGFGMIEVLVAVLILAIGLLGMGSLQTTGLKQTTEGRNRSQAVLLAHDVLERARANRDNLASYSVAAGTAPNCSKSYAIDNTKSVSVNDEAEWKNSLACLLPGGNGSVSLSGRRLTIAVTWDPQLADPASAGQDEGKMVIEAEI